jgi:Na+(H+)/acetate symporter ActP
VSTSGIVALVAIALVGVTSAIIGSIGVRVARSTSDFLVASRTVGPVANASAISGEYLSAASFLGVAGLVVVLTVVGGGMRSITFVQAFQYWLKLTALVVPAVFVLGLFISDNRSLDRDTAPDFRADTTVDVHTDVVLETSQVEVLAARGTVDGVRVNGRLTWEPGNHVVAQGTQLRFAGGAPVPTVAGEPTTDRQWLQPGSGDAEHQLLAIYSVLIAGALGTMGLPHVLVRFYTNPDGRAARRTTVAVLALIGGFYIVTVLVGVLSRLYTPELLSTGQTDAAVLLVPAAALGQGWTAWLLGGLVAAGTAAAFLSTSSGLVVSLAGVLFTDVLRGRWKDFRLAALLSAVLPIALALTVTRLDLALTVPLVFAVAASTFCPLLVLGIWWRGLTARGAAAGVLAGGVLSTSAVLASLLVPLPASLMGLLLYRPAIVTVPVAFLTMAVVSRLTRSEIPSDADDQLLRLHAPERLGLTHDRV